MPLNEYHFVSHWRVQGTLEEVGAILGDGPGLVRWWPSVYLDVHELEHGASSGLGRRVGLHTAGWLPYDLHWEGRVTEIRDDGFRLEAQGDLTGWGNWTLIQSGPWVEITYDWHIVADKPLLRWLSPLLRPIFAANHRWAMARGEQSLKLELLRRRAATAALRATIPAPPGRPSATEHLLVATLVLGGIALISLATRRIFRLLAP